MKCSKCEKRISVFSSSTVCAACQTIVPAWVRRAQAKRLPAKVLA